MAPFQQQTVLTVKCKQGSSLCVERLGLEAFLNVFVSSQYRHSDVLV